ncbi:MAG: hypothetical protein EXR95_06345 [Gemmatimonadetes bacterium]|nr:hypothetical protein [Gemmatimonadota bacterium]
MTTMRVVRAAGIGFGLMLATCSISGIDSEGRELSISSDAPASAEAVFQKAEAWIGRGTYQVLERRSPDLVRARRALSGQDFKGRLDIEITAVTATTSKYEIRVWTEFLGVKARANDAEMAADAESLRAALSCPAAKWPTCP